MYNHQQLPDPPVSKTPFSVPTRLRLSDRYGPEMYNNYCTSFTWNKNTVGDIKRKWNAAEGRSEIFI